jgi:hypothetical protein
VEQLMLMQLWGPAWEAAVAKAPEKGILTGGIWPHSNIGRLTDYTNVTKEKIKGECLGGSIGSNNNWFRGLEVMARMYNTADSKHYRSENVMKRVVAGIDFYQLAQGENGGFDPRPRLPSGWIGAPNRLNGSGCLEGYGHMGLSAAYLEVAASLPDDVLEEWVDADDTGVKTMTRRKAWTRLLVNSRDYLQWNRGHAPNQDLADQLAATLANNGLVVLSPTDALPRSEMLFAARQAVGLLHQPAGLEPWKPPAGAGPNITLGPGTWFSTNGLSMEPQTNVNGGYSHGYGDEEWALGWLAALIDDDAILKVARKHVANFGRFRYGDNCRFNQTGDVVVARCMRLESVITWRHNKNPGTISYGGGDPGAYMALHASEPTSVRLAQLRLEHGAVFSYDLASDEATTSPHWPDGLAKAAVEFSVFKALAALPKTAFRLPMETESPDFAWGDAQAAAVAVKHQGVRLFAYGARFGSASLFFLLLLTLIRDQ